MHLTVTTAVSSHDNDNDCVIQLNVEENETIENIKALIQVELQLAVETPQIYLFFQTKLLDDNTAKLVDIGIKEHDLIIVRTNHGDSGTTTTTTTTTAEAMSSNVSSNSSSLLPPAAPLSSVAREGMTMYDIPPNATPELLIEIMELNPRMLLQLEHSNAELGAALKSKILSDVRMVLMKQQMSVASKKYREDKEATHLNNNPFDAAAQSKIEENIRLGNVQQNMEMAMEQMPESFGKVNMLYIPCEVNNFKVKAFVDSGAQSTIMSSNCAERCGIMRLVDTRYSGQAVGVGTAKIIGRVHMAALKIGNVFFNCSFTILDQQSVDFLFGLDMLKRHQCCIDLSKSVLQLTGSSGVEEVPFLPEHEIPNTMFKEDGKLTPKATTATATEETKSSTTGTPLTTVASSDKLSQLIALGFDETRASQALATCNGDVDMAAGLLFEAKN